jgi:hypothetical protein
LFNYKFSILNKKNDYFNAATSSFG